MKQNIGHGVTIEVLDLDGRAEGLEYHHPAPAGRECGGWVPFKPAAPNGWDVVSLEPLTLSPSLLCTACGHHGWIRNGQWVSA